MDLNKGRHDNLPHDFDMEGTASVNVEAANVPVGTQPTLDFTSADGTLTITGVEDATGKHITINISTQPSPTAPLVANLSVSPTNGIIPWTVTADASLSSGSAPIRTYAWNWGDGNTTAAATSSSATHTYTTAGTFTITVTVVDSANTSKTASKTVVSSASATGGVDLVVTALSASPSAPVAGDAVTFSVTGANNGTVAVPAGQAAGQNIGVGIYVDGVVTTYTNYDSGLAGGANFTRDTSTGWSFGGPWTATAGAHEITAHINDSNTIAELDSTNNTLTIPLAVTIPPAASVVTDRGSTNAITAGTTLASGTFTPAAGSLLVVVTEGTTI